MIENTPPSLPGDSGDKKECEETDQQSAEPITVSEAENLDLRAIEEEHEPIVSFAGAAEAVLRQPRRIFFQIGEAGGPRLIGYLLMLSMLGLLGYGLVIGTFKGGAQLWASPVKIAGGMFVASLICLPSLYIFSCLAGGRASLRQLAGLLVGLLAIMTLLLIGFAPVAWVFSQSTDSIPMMGALHLAFWGVAMYFAVAFFRAGFNVLVTEKDTGVLQVWMTVFVVVVLQMSTALRPIIGEAETFMPTEKQFFLKHWLLSISDKPKETEKETER